MGNYERFRSFDPAVVPKSLCIFSNVIDSEGRITDKRVMRRLKDEEGKFIVPLSVEDAQFIPPIKSDADLKGYVWPYTGTYACMILRLLRDSVDSLSSSNNGSWGPQDFMPKMFRGQLQNYTQNRKRDRGGSSIVEAESMRVVHQPAPVQLRAPSVMDFKTREEALSSLLGQVWETVVPSKGHIVTPLVRFAPSPSLSPFPFPLRLFFSVTFLPPF